MTFLELCEALRRECSVAGDGPSTVISQTGEYLRLVEWIKRADKEIQGKYVDWNFLWAQTTLATIASTQDYTLPAEVGKVDVDNVYITVSSVMSQMDYLPWEDYDPTESYGSNRDPYEFTILPNGKLRCLPTPDDAYTITYNYWLKPAELDDTDDDAESVIPSQYHDLIVYRAMMFYANYENAPEVMAQGGQGYGELMQQLEQDQLPNRYGRFAQTNDIVIRPV